MGGYVKPNYTQLPNALLDHHLPDMKEAELKVVLAIARATFGWHKEKDKLSLSQLMERTGLTRQGVVNGIQNGIERGIIARIEDGMGFVYSLVIEDQLVNEVDYLPAKLVNEVDQSTKKTSQRKRLELVNEVDQLSPKLVNEVDSQKKGIKERERKREVSAQSDPLDVPVQPLSPATASIQEKNNAKGKAIKGQSKQQQPPPPKDADAPLPANGRKVVRVKSPYLTDPRRFVNGFIPPGTGINQIEIYYERFDIRHDKERLSAPIEDDLVSKCPDLDRFRAVIEAYSRTAYQRRNIELILDWYHDGIPEKNKRNPTHDHAKTATPPSTIDIDWAETFGSG